MFSSVARMPIIRPAEPVITPADRSNSPPIISSATATAGMPIVEATSVQLAMPSRWAHSEIWVVKKIATASAASSEPSSGRRRIRASGLILASRSSPTGTGGGGAAGAASPVAEPDVIASFEITLLSSCAERRGAGSRSGWSRPPGAALARARLGELRDGVDVGLVDEAGAGEDRQAAADGVGVGLEQLQEHDRQVALQVLLLVDREPDRARL